MNRLLCIVVAVALLAARVEHAVGDSIYWADYGPFPPVGVTGDIQRANLDGTGRSSLVTGLSNPFGIALDVAGGTMYWAASEIGRANLDGTGRTSLIPLPNAGPLAVALDLVNGTIYWVEGAQYGGPGHNRAGFIGRANLDGTGITGILYLPGPTRIALDPKVGRAGFGSTQA